MVFFLLITMVVFASFMVILNQNTSLEQTVIKTRQMDNDKAKEQLTMLAPLYNPTTQAFSCRINNTGTLSAQVVRIWIEDLTTNTSGSLQVITNGEIQPNKEKPYSGSITVQGATSGDTLRFWFITARGNQFTLEQSNGGILSQSDFNQQLSKVFGDFLPDYKSVQWAYVTTTTAGSTAGQWQSGWTIPTNTSNLNIAFRLNVTYYGSTPITIGNDTNIWFNNLQQDSVVFENNEVSTITIGSGWSATTYYTGVWPTLYLTNYTQANNKLNLYMGNELAVQPSTNPTPITLYFSSIQNWIAPTNSYSGGFTNWGMTAYGSPTPIGYPINCISPNAQMSLVLYGKSPSSYAQTFTLFAVQTRQISINLNPTSGVVGTSVTLKGTAFAANSAISLTFDSTQVTIPTTTTDSTGAFTATFTVPQAGAGSHTVTATDNAINHNAAAATFTVTPSLSLPAPSLGPLGTSVAISGTGFAANSAMSVTLGGVVQPTSPTTIVTNSLGTFSGSFTATAFATGPQVIIVSDTNGNTANSAFTVTVPTISVSPSSVAVGATVTVTGSNFLPSALLSVTYDNVLVTTATSTSGGALPSGVTFAVPQSTYGSHVVKVTDSYGNFATATVSAAPSISVNPNSGSVGASVVVSGSGFAASSVVTLTFAGTAVATTPSPVITDSTGSFSASFIIPTDSSTGSIAGAKTVTAMDAGSHIGSTTFTITPAVTLNPTSGNVDSSVTISGTGYGPSKTITVKYDGATQTTTPSTVTTTAYGTFSCTFNVPTSTNGNHIVSAVDSSSNTGSTTYSVASTIILTPSSGTPRSTVTIAGAGFGGSKAIMATFDDVTVTLGGSTTTSSAGSFSATFTVPASVKGSHTVVVADSDSNAASASLTVTQGIILTPSNGSVGSTVTVSGDGFLASSTVTLTYNSIVQTTTPATITNNASGSFTATFVIPASASASNIVQASDGINTASATFTVVVSITITSNPTGSGYVTVDSNLVATPAIFNWALGSSHTLQANSPVSGGTGIQYIYTSWSDSGSQTHSYTVPSSPQTITATFKTQYRLSISTNFGTTTPTTGTWYDVGSTVTITAAPPTVGSGEQYLWNGWTGSGSGSYSGISNPALNAVTMNGPVTETASYTHQYQLTFAQSGLTSDATGTVATIAGAAKTYDDLPFTVWVDASSGSVTYSYTTTVTSSTTGKQFVKTSTDASPVTGLSGPLTVTGTYKTQWQVTFSQTGIDSSAGSNTILTVGSTNYAYNALPTSTWYDSGTTFSWASTVSAGTGKQFAITGTSGNSPITAGGTYTATYHTVQILKAGTDTESHGTSLTISWSHTLVAESNRMVVVYLGLEHNGD